jgi:hypothetical protein
VHAELDEFGDAGWAFLDDGADDVLFAEASAGLECIANVEFEGIFLTGNGGDAALGIIGIRLGAIFLGDDSNAAVRGDFESEGKAGDAAAEDEEIEVFQRLKAKG